MPRISLIPLNEKNRGLWITGPREHTDPNYLRRNQGVHLLRERVIRSRTGTTADALIAAAHSLHKFNDVRFQGASTILYRNGIMLDTGYDGTRLTMQTSEPKTGTDLEYLFVSGGGKLRKVDTSGTVTQWGIDAPAAGIWGASIGGSEENTNAVTVFDPQETTVAATTSTSNWFAFGAAPQGVRAVSGQENPSGIMICAETVESGTEQQEG